MGILVVGCGITVLAVAGWRSFTLARQALAPLVHDGEPTRTAIEAARPPHARFRVRQVARRVVAAVGWMIVALYGLFLIQAGSLSA
jgi:hypothetical protein